MRMYRNIGTGATILVRRIDEATTIDTVNGPVKARRGDYLTVGGGMTAVIRKAFFKCLYVPDDGA